MDKAAIARMLELLQRVISDAEAHAEEYGDDPTFIDEFRELAQEAVAAIGGLQSKQAQVVEQAKRVERGGILISGWANTGGTSWRSARIPAFQSGVSKCRQRWKQSAC